MDSFKKIIFALAVLGLTGMGCKNNSTTSPNAAHPFSFSIGTTIGNGFNDFNTPAGLAVDGSDNLYVSDFGNHRIKQYNSAGRCLMTWSSAVASATNVSDVIPSPYGLRIDAGSNLFVVDKNGRQIDKFSTAGVLSTNWAQPAGALSAWVGINKSTGDVYVSDGPHYDIHHYDNNGNLLGSFGQFGSGPTIGNFNGIGGVAVDSTGQVYAVDEGSHRIEIFTSAGAPVTYWSLGDRSPVGGMQFDASGNLWVMDTDDQTILEFNSTGSLILTWANPGGSAQPTDIAFDSTGAFWVSYQDTEDAFLVKYSH
jgi:sugar lactone lactonase YvrE